MQPRPQGPPREGNAEGPGDEVGQGEHSTENRNANIVENVYRVAKN